MSHTHILPYLAFHRSPLKSNWSPMFLITVLILCFIVAAGGLTYKIQSPCHPSTLNIRGVSRCGRDAHALWSQDGGDWWNIVMSLWYEIMVIIFIFCESLIAFVLPAPALRDLELLRLGVYILVKCKKSYKQSSKLSLSIS